MKTFTFIKASKYKDFPYRLDIFLEYLYNIIKKEMPKAYLTYLKLSTI